MEDRSAEEGEPPTMPPAPPTPPTKRKSKFAGIGKIFKPWKWRKRKSSDSFRETSEVLERKISMRKPREELVKRGVLLEVPEEDVPVASESPPLRNGHMNLVPPDPQEDEGLLKRKSRLDSTGPQPASDTAPIQDVPREPSKQPLLPPKRPLSVSNSTSTAQEFPEGQKADLGPTVLRQQISAPSPAPRTLHPSTAPKQPPAPPPKPQNRNSNPLMAELCQALGGSTLSPAGSRPSPPLPAKRGVHLSTDAVSNKEKINRPASLPPASASEVPASEAPAPTPPSPPLPSHIPVILTPDPPHVLPLPSTEADKVQLPANLPLHIRIQQALNSPQPMPIVDSSQRAQSLLFVHNEAGEGEERVRVRSLPVTIELLKVPDDDYDEEEDISLEEESLSPESSDPPPSRVYIGDVPSVSVIPGYLPPCLQEEEEGGVSDSDSEGPILYREEEEDEEEEETRDGHTLGGGSKEEKSYLLHTASPGDTGSLANKVKRKDTLAMKLSEKLDHQGPHPEFPQRSREEWNQIRQQIGSQLNRRLSQRPTAEELEQRNILQQKNEADRLAEKREIKRRLTRKLSQRPTVAELLDRKILRFNEYVEVTDAHEYDRRADKPWTKLTPADKAAIRKELNEFKSSEMAVHEESKHYTRFHRP